MTDLSEKIQLSDNDTPDINTDHNGSSGTVLLKIGNVEAYCDFKASITTNYIPADEYEPELFELDDAHITSLNVRDACEIDADGYETSIDDYVLTDEQEIEVKQFIESLIKQTPNDLSIKQARFDLQYDHAG